MSRRNHDFQTIRSEGGLLPPDLLRRVLDPKASIDDTRNQALDFLSSGGHTMKEDTQ